MAKKNCGTFVNIFSFMASKLFLLFIIPFCTFHICLAQEFSLKEEKTILVNQNEKEKKDSLIQRTKIGEIQVFQDQRIDSLLKKHQEINESKKTIEGFRVQISTASGANSRKASNDVKASFLSKYSDVDAYIVHQAPNFKVRVGDFRSKLDASKFLNQVKKDFPGAFIVKDEINLPKL